MSETSYSTIEEQQLNFDIEKHARERWWHEDELVNQRTTWLLTTQGVIATAFGFVKYRVAELSFKSPTKEPEYDFTNYIGTLQLFADCMVAVGFVSSLVSLLGIYAALRAQNFLQKTHGRYLGVSDHTTRLGHFVGVFTPMLCAIAWLVSLAVFRQ